MIWRMGDRPLDKHTVEERILRGLYLTGMNWVEARDFLDLHDAATVKDATSELYNQVWKQDDYDDAASKPSRGAKLRAWIAGCVWGARAVHTLAIERCDWTWREYKRRYAMELTKPDVETKPVDDGGFDETR